MAIISARSYLKLIEGIGFYYSDKFLDQLKPTTFLAMFETADGCIKFTEVSTATPTVVFAFTRPAVMGEAIGPDKREPFDQVLVMRRRYELRDRSGPGGMILHYKEII